MTLNLLHFREETEGRFRAAYASFCHEPDDVAEMERVLGCPVHTEASWNGWALSRETVNFRSGGATRVEPFAPATG